MRLNNNKNVNLCLNKERQSKSLLTTTGYSAVMSIKFYDILVIYNSFIKISHPVFHQINSFNTKRLDTRRKASGWEVKEVGWVG